MLLLSLCSQAVAQKVFALWGLKTDDDYSITSSVRKTKINWVVLQLCWEGTAVGSATLYSTLFVKLEVDWPHVENQ